ncbi:hypothetical protein GCK32_009919 [Trichostrongylus colubriformis]|uniref:Endonuclease/exonuclease/phosphatase domain-containing protein n=1 Tax=Trichostrongylus colubriformis TaxID=6319 RepID=A0AAN8FDG2_TRICO
MNSKVVIGDFNAKIGSGEENEKFIGKYGLGIRNKRGEILANFCSESELYVMNNRFKKRKSRKWTWISPNMQTKNAIDFVLSTDQSIFSDVDIMGRFKFVSDHRLVMAKIRIQSKHHRYPRAVRTTTNINESIFAAALERLVSDKVPESYEGLKNAMKVAAETATSEVPKRSHFSETTRKLFEKRHFLVQQCSTRSTVEFSVINKLLRLSLRSDLEQKHLLRLEEAVSKGSSLRQVLHEKKVCRTTLTRLKKIDGSIAETPTSVASLVQDYYRNLFSSTKATPTLPQMTDSEDVPQILPEEIKHAIKMMKLGKKPGPDRVTAEMLIAAYHILEKPLTKLFNDFLNDERLPTVCSFLLTYLPGASMSKAPASAASDAPPSSAAGGGGSPIEGLKKAHKLDASGVKREHIAYGVIAVMSLYLIGGEEAMFLSYVITFFYPASASVEAVRSKNSGEALNELQYWIPFGFFALIDSTAISSFPAWYFMKTVILVFLFLPQTRGSLLLFQKVIDPISRVIEGITKKK